VAVEKIHLDVVVLGHAYGRAYEDHGDQLITRDLLGPRGRVVENVTRDELVQHRGAQHPEKSQRHPAFDGDGG
jgi:hypothetical protein